MRFHVITIFPEIFTSYLDESLFKRARAEKIVSVDAYDLRHFSKDRHKKVDDRPFGGGPGMVFKVQPIHDAVASILKKRKKAHVILFSTRGKTLDAKVAKRLAKYDDLVLICGRYEGVDERVAKQIADEEISIGEFVLSGGELPALVLMESVSRFIPGFLGKEASLEENNGSFPTYTRPEVFSPKKGKAWPVPDVLLSGNHKKIAEWRKKAS
jgi:tRNA (guanine37-N1)-methyltransferase